MATSKNFVAKNGLDNNGNALLNVGAAGSSLSQSGAFALTLTATATTNVTLPTTGTLAVVGANTFTGAQNFNGQQLTSALLKNSAFVYVDKGTVSSGTVTFDYSAGSNQRLQVGGALTLATSTWPNSGNMGELVIELVNGASATLTWPTINWIKSDGTTTTTFSSNGVTLQTSGTDFVILWTRDGGSTIYGKIVR